MKGGGRRTSCTYKEHRILFCLQLCVLVAEPDMLPGKTAVLKAANEEFVQVQFPAEWRLLGARAAEPVYVELLRFARNPHLGTGPGAAYSVAVQQGVGLTREDVVKTGGIAGTGFVRTTRKVASAAHISW